ncbi:MAG: hypothetical protein ABR980_07545 [Ignavibacteriaceae bacterium]|jgi:hypothetical protein
MGNNIESRLQKILEKLSPQKNMAVIIDYITSEPESYFLVNGTKYIIPHGINVSEYINDKLKNYNGVVAASVYIAKDITKNSSSVFSDLASKKNDFVIKIKGYDSEQ